MTRILRNGVLALWWFAFAVILIAWPRSYLCEELLVFDPPASDGDPIWYSSYGCVGRGIIPIFTYTEITSSYTRGWTPGARICWWPARINNRDGVSYCLPYWCVLVAVVAPAFAYYLRELLGLCLQVPRRFRLAGFFGFMTLVAYLLAFPTGGGMIWAVLLGEVVGLLLAAVVCYRHLERPKTAAACFGLAALLTLCAWHSFTIPFI